MADNIIEFDSIDSTNSKAKQLINQDGCNDWTVILSKEQTSGHGKQNSEWFSPSGGLYFSVILPKADIKDIQIITILAAFAVGSAIKEKYKLEPMIKLPNDIYINNKKFCGILTENIISGSNIFSVIGIGINTNINEFKDDLKGLSTSLFIEMNEKIDNRELLMRVVEELKKYFKEIIN